MIKPVSGFQTLDGSFHQSKDLAECYLRDNLSKILARGLYTEGANKVPVFDKHSADRFLKENREAIFSSLEIWYKTQEPPKAKEIIH